MVKTNKTYDAPDMKVYQVHTEGVMCESIDANWHTETLGKDSEEDV